MIVTVIDPTEPIDLETATPFESATVVVARGLRAHAIEGAGDCVTAEERERVVAAIAATIERETLKALLGRPPIEYPPLFASYEPPPPKFSPSDRFWPTPVIIYSIEFYAPLINIA